MNCFRERKRTRSREKDRGSLFLRKRKGFGLTRIDSLLFCQTSDTPASRGDLRRGREEKERREGRGGEDTRNGD